MLSKLLAEENIQAESDRGGKEDDFFELRECVKMTDQKNESGRMFYRVVDYRLNMHKEHYRLD